MSATLQREHWNGQPTRLGELFIVGKERHGKSFEAVCHLWTPRLRFANVRLEIDGDPAVGVVGRWKAVSRAAETWKKAMIEKGAADRIGPVESREGQKAK